VAYLSGHVHTSLGTELYGQHLVPNHQLWEWTLADWKVRESRSPSARSFLLARARVRSLVGTSQ
jgi:hypothetical protein